MIGDAQWVNPSFASYEFCRLLPYLFMFLTYIASNIVPEIPWEQSDQGFMIKYSLKCTGIYGKKTDDIFHKKIISWLQCGSLIACYVILGLRSGVYNRPLAGYGLPPPPRQGEFCRPYFS